MIDISSARKNLSKIVDQVYLDDRSFVIAKRNIPIVKIVKFKLTEEKTLPVKKTLDLSLFGLLAGKKQGSVALAKDLRVKTWLRN